VVESSWVQIHVTERLFRALDDNEMDIDSTDWSNGLVAPMAAGGALVCTGIHYGVVRVASEELAHPPEVVDLQGWDDVVEASVDVAAGALQIGSLEGLSPFPVPQLSSGVAGSYRLRVHVRGRDTIPDAVAVDDEGEPWPPVEDYLSLAWAAPYAPQVLHKTTDACGASLRLSVEGRPPPRPTPTVPPTPQSQAAYDNLVAQHLASQQAQTEPGSPPGP
jgi:hypothetical protein